MSPTTTLTLQVSPGLKERLHRLARVTARSEDMLAQEALGTFLDLYDWQLRAIQKGVEAADADRLVDHEPVAAWLESWGTADELPAPECD